MPWHKFDPAFMKPDMASVDEPITTVLRSIHGLGSHQDVDSWVQKQWANSKKDHMASLGIVGSVRYDKPIHTIVTGSQIDTPAFKSWFGVSTRARWEHTFPYRQR